MITETSLKRYAILCGSAPKGFIQSKINKMHSFLTNESGLWQEKEIAIFPNGVTSLMLSFLFERLIKEKIEQILLYICTESAVKDEEKSFWLCGNEIRKDDIEKYFFNNSSQIIFDICKDFEQEEEL